MTKRLIALLLASVLIFCCFTGCGKDEPQIEDQLPVVQDEPKTDETVTEPVFVHHASFLPIELDPVYEAEQIGAFCASDHALFFTAECRTEAPEAQDPLMDELYAYQSYVTRVFSMDPDTGGITLLEGYEPFEIPEGWGGYVSLNGISAGANGTVWVNELITTFRYALPEDFVFGEDDASVYYEKGVNMNRFIQLDSAGNLLRELTLEPGEDMQFSNILADDSGYVYAATWAEIQVYDSQGNYAGVLDTQGLTGDLIRLNAETIGLRCWVNGSQLAFLPIDSEALTLGAQMDIGTNYREFLLGSEDYQFVYMNNGILYGHAENAESDERILSLLNCDVNADAVKTCYFLDDGRLATIETAADGFNLVLIDLVDASTLPQKQALTIACLGVSSDLRSDVVAFNRSSDDSKITVLDYSEYNTAEDLTAGLTRLRTEVLSGNAPDLLYADAQMPVEQFASKGLLMDLWPMIDGDGELSRDDLMTHFFDVLSTDGKLYRITDAFTIQTAAGLKRVVGDRSGWTLEELLSVRESLGAASAIFDGSDTKASVLGASISRSLDGFINWNDPEKPVSFESEAFLSLLEFANSFPAEYVWSPGLTTSENQRLAAGQQLLKETELFDFDQIRYTELETGEAVSYIGYPSACPGGNSFRISGGFAITTACQSPELAWSFVRTYLTEDYQTAENRSDFPTNRHAFEAMAERAMAPAAGEEAEEELIYWVNNVPVIVEPLTQTQYDTIMAAYEASNTVAEQDQAVSDIITEAAAAYFSGEKTAEETAAAIQERVSQLVMERN